VEKFNENGDLNDDFDDFGVEFWFFRPIFFKFPAVKIFLFTKHASSSLFKKFLRTDFSKK